MEDQGQDPNIPSHGSERSEPVRSRWTPKPEQILILESIFNSGMVNPPKDETVRIRKILEKFGSVGDANVFYWFQNRRSRSRRRQRQMQATLEQRNQLPPQVGGAIPYQQTTPTPAMPFGASSPFADSSSSYLAGSSSSCGFVGGQDAMDGFFSVSAQMGFPESDQSSAASSILYPPEASTLGYHSVPAFEMHESCTFPERHEATFRLQFLFPAFIPSFILLGFITVFINGIATEVPRGPMDIKTMFGQDVILIHSSGMPVPANEFGFLMETLQHGESYFLVSKPT